MKSAVPILALASLFATQATAHTTLQYFWTDSSTSTTECVRAPPNNNPVQDVTSADMACNVNGNVPAASVCEVTAGSTVIHEWHHTNREQGATDADDPIASSHKGPIITYMAKVDDSSTVTDVTSLDWFKIAEDGLSGGVWAVDTFYADKTGKWSVKIPTNIPDGDYLLRGEIIALHSASSYPGAQLYMGCVQLRVTGGSGGTPSPTAKFPGAYASTDPGITCNIYSGLTTYEIPGRKFHP
ncbi:glycoside hydrolase [Morchella conica CCBAS932]|uniref:AA9 family lytic polysaccharide monooxygenase n=1 Tax=Morchella conica CCBAS932 TaxID=1392247 RepID=A0A3N4L370_9PEZI|nr:glycoside hydrolase [Morchella conica CCBAS932]